MMNQCRFLSDSDYMIFNNEKHPSLPVLLNNKEHVYRFSSALSTTNIAQISFDPVYILTITSNLQYSVHYLMKPFCILIC